MGLVLKISAYGWKKTNYIEGQVRDFDGEAYSECGLDGSRLGGRANGKLIDDCIGNLSIGGNVKNSRRASLMCDNLGMASYMYGSHKSVGNTLIRTARQFKAINREMSKKLPVGSESFGCIVREIMALIDVLGINEVHFVPSDVTNGTSWIDEKLALTDKTEIFSELNRHFNDAVDAST